MQHITPNSKRWVYSDIPDGGHKKIKGPAHLVEGGHHFKKAPIPTHQLTMRNGISCMMQTACEYHKSVYIITKLMLMLMSHQWTFLAFLKWRGHLEAYVDRYYRILQLDLTQSSTYPSHIFVITQAELGEVKSKFLEALLFTELEFSKQRSLGVEL